VPTTPSLNFDQNVSSVIALIISSLYSCILRDSSSSSIGNDIALSFNTEEQFGDCTPLSHSSYLSLMSPSNRANSPTPNKNLNVEIPSLKPPLPYILFPSYSLYSPILLKLSYWSCSLLHILSLLRNEKFLIKNFLFSTISEFISPPIPKSTDIIKKVYDIINDNVKKKNSSFVEVSEEFFHPITISRIIPLTKLSNFYCPQFIDFSQTSSSSDFSNPFKDNTASNLLLMLKLHFLLSVLHHADVWIQYLLMLILNIVGKYVWSSFCCFFFLFY
jgi:hypothetical protein